MHCKLTSRHYRRSPLVQGGLEIKCEVVVNSRATVLQSRLTAHYLELIQNLYTEPVEERVMGELVFNCHDITSNGEHVCIANTGEKKEKSYHDQCYNQKSRHS